MADRFGKGKVYGTCALLIGIAVSPTFWVLNNYAQNLLYVCIALSVPFWLFHSAVFDTMVGLFSESFDASVRYSGISFVYQFTAIFASGLIPMISAELTKLMGGEPWLLCGYMLVIACMSTACTKWLGSMSKDEKTEQITVKKNI